jgi:hypothetical protein
VTQQTPTRWIVILLLAGWLASTGGLVARADGYVIPEPMPSSSIMADQRAVLVYQDGREDLVISVGLDLAALDAGAQMAWVIPVPSTPQVQAADAALFDELDQLSAPEIVYKTEYRRGHGWGLSAGNAPPPVQVLERKQVGVYDVAVLTSGEGHALLDWLHAEGFAVPDALQPPLDAYAAEGWTFVAMRIEPGADWTQVHDAAPIWLSFKTGRMVYPMRLTGVRDDPLALRLYVLADHRYEMDGFTVEFAGPVQVELPEGDMTALFGREFFLTKLFDETLTPAEMAADFYPYQALNDDPYREQVVQTYVSYGPSLGLGEVLCLGGLCCGGPLLLLAVLLSAIWLVIRHRRDHT